MININDIDTSASQKMILEGENQEAITLELFYKPAVQAWFFSLSYDDFSITNKKLVNSPNLLRNFKNILPFGLSCVVTDGSDPYFIYDFDNERCSLNLLNEEEVQYIEEEIFNE